MDLLHDPSVCDGPQLLSASAMGGLLCATVGE